MKNSQKLCCLTLLYILIAALATADDQIPVATPMTTDLAGRSGNIAVPSVYRIVCPSKNRGGTGFRHKSGRIITAAHVVVDCKPSEILAVGVTGMTVRMTNVITDAHLDLALLVPANLLDGPSLPITPSEEFSIGSQVSTWGYPSGYHGLAPLLSSGYLSGFDRTKSPADKPILRLVVNAAFNSGNSGGPLLCIEKGLVIGVVCSKLAPMPPHIEQALSALKSSKNITQFVRTYPDGRKENVSTANVVEEVLQYLRSQTQLVIGYAVLAKDLRSFLEQHGIEP